MKGKKVLGIPLNDDNPFEVAIMGGMEGPEVSEGPWSSNG